MVVSILPVCLLTLFIGAENLGQMLHGVLFEPGHPEQTIEIAIDNGVQAAQALSVNGLPCKIKFDLTCQP